MFLGQRCHDGHNHQFEFEVTLAQGVSGKGVSSVPVSFLFKSSVARSIASSKSDRAIDVGPFIGAARLLREHAPQNLGDVEKSKLNRMLLVASVPEGKAPVIPGNLYIDGAKTNHLFRKCWIDRDVLVNDLADIFKSPALAAAQARLDAEKKKPTRMRNESDVKTLEAAVEQQKQEVLSGCFTVLAEITASCDHAQMKQKTARFVAGILVRDEKILLPRADYIRRLEPIFFEKSEIDPAGIYTLALSSHFICSVPLREVDAPAIARLRNPVVVDIQSWMGSQLARPG